MLCTDASPVHPVLKNLLLGADVIAPMQYSDVPSVQPVLKKLLLGTLTSSLEHRTPNAPMPFLGPSVQPVPIG